MTLKLNGFWSPSLWAAAGRGPVGAGARAGSAAGSRASSTPTFRVQIDAVTMDVIVKDDQGRFIPDLKKDEFEIYEDGVKQDIASMTMSHGGRVTNVLEAPPPPPPEGHHPAAGPRASTTHPAASSCSSSTTCTCSSRTRDACASCSRRFRRTSIHEGDLFGIVSSGPSSISHRHDLRPEAAGRGDQEDHGRRAEAERDHQHAAPGREGPTELRYRAHVAFSTMQEALDNLEKVHNRRKALVWVSEGYDFNPFQESRLGLRDPQLAVPAEPVERDDEQRRTTATARRAASTDPMIEQQKQTETFSDADLAFELGEITRAANRANTTIYTIDPRGLVAGVDIDEQVDPREWGDYVRKSQDSMRVLAEETGGIAVVNMNDFDKALKRIDAASSDYYVLGYYSSNPDPTKRRRKVEVKVTRKGVDVFSRKEYVLKPPPKPAAPSADASSSSCASLRAFAIRATPRPGSAARSAAVAIRSTASFKIDLVDIRADEVHAEPRAGDRRAAKSRERIHHRLDAREPCSRRHCSGSRDGNVAGCGRSRSRR